MSGHTAEERIDAIAREITNEIRCEERARERIAEAPLEGDVYLLKILLDVIDNQNAALKEQHPIVNSHADLVRALRVARDWMMVDIEHGDEEQFDIDLALVDAALATLTARKVG